MEAHISPRKTGASVVSISQIQKSKRAILCRHVSYYWRYSKCWFGLSQKFLAAAVQMSAWVSIAPTTCAVLSRHAECLAQRRKRKMRNTKQWRNMAQPNDDEWKIAQPTTIQKPWKVLCPYIIKNCWESQTKHQQQGTKLDHKHKNNHIRGANKT